MPELRLLQGCAGASRLRCAESHLRMRVEEEAAAYKLSAQVPGSAASEVRVEVQASSVGKAVLAVRLERKEGAVLERRLELPEGVDAQHTTAWCADGLLQITVPKLPEAQAVVVQPQAVAPPESAAAEPTQMETESESETRSKPAPYELVRQLPGFSAAELELRLEGPWLELRAKSSAGFGEQRLSYGLPEDAIAEQTEAFCHNGVLTVRIPRRAPASPLAVPVRAATQATEEQLQIARINVPGYGVEDLSVSMHAEHLEVAMKHPTHDKSRKLLVSMPAALQQWYRSKREGEAAAPVEALVGNGVLLVVAQKQAMEEPKAQVVTVEAERPAATKA